MSRGSDCYVYSKVMMGYTCCENLVTGVKIRLELGRLGTAIHVV